MLFSLFQCVAWFLRTTFLGRLPGSRGLFFLLYRIFRPKGTVTLRVDGLQLLVDVSDTGEVPELLATGHYDPLECRVIKESLREGMTAVDVGAHVGYFSLLMAKAVGMDGRVIAIEPAPPVYAFLKANVERNHFPNVTLVNKALSATAGTATLFIDAQNLGNPTLSKDNISSSARAGAVDVRTTTLDAVVGGRPVHFIKLDVQGAEGLVLEGATHTLRRHHPTILMEFWPYGLRNLGTNPRTLLEDLVARGYRIYALDRRTNTLTPTTVEAILAIEENRPGGKGWANVLLLPS